MGSILFVLAIGFVAGTGYFSPYRRSRHGTISFVIAVLAALVAVAVIGNSGLAFRGKAIRVSRWTMGLFVGGVTYNISIAGAFLLTKFVNRALPRLPA